MKVLYIVSMVLWLAGCSDPKFFDLKRGETSALEDADAGKPTPGSDGNEDAEAGRKIVNIGIEYVGPGKGAKGDKGVKARSNGKSVRISGEETAPGKAEEETADASSTVDDDLAAHGQGGSQMTANDKSKEKCASRERPSAAGLQSQLTLWPPNGKMIPLRLTFDREEAASCSVKSVTCNECGAESFQLLGGELLKLQARRLGDGSGRIYKIAATCLDKNGDELPSREVKVIVPHDQGHGKP